MARTGCLGLENTLQKWNISDGICKLCNEGIEDLSHLMFTCQKFTELRIKMWQNLEKCLLETGNTKLWNEFAESPLSNKLILLFGGTVPKSDKTAHDILDGACREFLRKAGRSRKETLDHFGETGI